MWKLTSKERKLLKKIIPAAEFKALKIQCPNGGQTGLEELMKRDRISADEVDAIYKGLANKEIEFFKFVNALRPFRPNELDEELSEEQKKAKQKHRERTQKLKEKQANLEYAKMVENIDYSSRNRPLLENFGQEMREVNRQIVAVTNTMITVGGAFAFGFWGIEFAYPHLKLDIAERMLMGLVFGTIVFMADLYFIVKGMDVKKEEKEGEKKKN